MVMADRAGESHEHGLEVVVSEKAMSGSRPVGGRARKQQELHKSRSMTGA